MLDTNWTELNNSLELTLKTAAQLFGKIRKVKRLMGPFNLYEFNTIDLIAIDLGSSWIKIIKIKHRREKFR